MHNFETRGDAMKMYHLLRTKRSNEGLIDYDKNWLASLSDELLYYHINFLAEFYEGKADSVISTQHSRRSDAMVNSIKYMASERLEEEILSLEDGDKIQELDQKLVIIIPEMYPKN